jgi:hypothetical protein
MSKGHAGLSIAPEGLSWANAANENNAAAGVTRRSPSQNRRASGPAVARYVPPSRRNRGAAPKNGDTRGEGAEMMIFTTDPIILANGTRVRGHWVKAIDPHGDYGGPYSDLMQLFGNPRWEADMANIRRDRERAAAPTRRSRSKSRSRSRSRGQ